MLAEGQTHTFYQIGVLIAYFIIIISVACFSYKKKQSGADFILGSRSSNFWLTAFSAQASDMGSWLFLGYPALIFSEGLFSAWAAIGLCIGMFLNWHFVAARLREVTGQFGSLTLNAYFEVRFNDFSGKLRLISGVMSVVFFIIYISSGLVATGVLLESLFGCNYYLGVVLGVLVVVAYVFTGGYRTVAWIDLFQGIFLLGVIVCVPVYLIHGLSGLQCIMTRLDANNFSVSLFPDFSVGTLWKITITAATWGLGYFGQPHILTKFMGIRHTHEMWKAKYVGIGWLVVTLTAATMIGLIGIDLFCGNLNDPQQVVLNIITMTLSPIFSGLVICAILAATTNVMAAHMLIVASNLSEDFYRRFFCKNTESTELIWVSKLSVLLAAAIAGSIAFAKPSTIYKLVLYAWSGLGASFGPLVILSLYSQRINSYGAFSGICVGGIVTAVWPFIDQSLQWGLAPIIPGFALSLIAIWCGSVLLGTKTRGIAVTPLAQ